MTSAISANKPARWRIFAPDHSLIRLPQGFDRRLDAGEIVLCGGRSSSHGPKARDLAARDLIANVELLRDRSGLDFTSVIPSLEVLKELLAKAPTETSVRSDGEPMQHRFILVDLTHTAPIKLFLGTGSGRYLDEEMDQPFIKRAALEYIKNNACIFAAKNLDRAGRQGWGLAPLASAIALNDGAICDEGGLGPMDLARSLTSFVKGMGAQEQAEKMPSSVRREQVNRTDREMIGGQARYHAALRCPPGFSTVWLKSQSGIPEVRILHLDTDSCRPADELVAFGLSEVRHSEGHPLAGQRVDQVTNVRFILAHLRLTGWSNQRIVNELVEMDYSTETRRSRDGASASLPPKSTHQVLDAIMNNLDLYETGILVRDVGAGIEPISIVNCFPPDGPWATAKDFARIRSHTMQRQESTDAYARLTFAGLHGTLNGVPVVMLSDRGHSRRSRNDQTPHYTFATEDGYPHGRHAPEGNRLLGALAFAESLVNGLIEAGDAPLEIFDPSQVVNNEDAGLNRLRIEESQLLTGITVLERKLDSIVKRLEETDAAGTLLLRGALLVDSQDRYNSIVEEQLPTMRHRLTAIKHEIDDLTSREPKSGPIDAILHLVESLRDPTSRKFRSQWLASLRNVAFTSGLSRKDGRTIKELSWTGKVVLHGGGSEFVIRFQGSYAYPWSGKLEDPVSEAARMATAMSDGVIRESLGRRKSQLLTPLIASQLGIDTGHMLLNGCDDPRILRVAMALLRARGSVSGVEVETGEDEAFIRRVREVHFKQNAIRRWMIEPLPTKAAFYAVAAANNGDVTAAAVQALDSVTSTGQIYNVARELRRVSGRWVTKRKRGYELSPCTCGSTSGALMMIPEPVGTLCLDCRRDEAGIEWPATPYDRYLATLASSRPSSIG